MEFKNNSPIYLQIADELCRRILAGDYAEEEKLPSVRETAVEMEVNVNTVARAFEWLQMNEVVQVRRGMGNFVAGGAREKITALQRDEFFHAYLPDLFRRMQLLGILMQRVVEEYEQFKKMTEND